MLNMAASSCQVEIISISEIYELTPPIELLMGRYQSSWLMGKSVVSSISVFGAELHA